MAESLIERHSPTWAELRRDPLLLLAFGFGSGLARRAPGTAGSLVALLLFPVLALLPPAGYGMVVAVALVAGVPLCARAAGARDHPGIVWDEFVGLWIALAGCPLQWQWLLAGFACFRLFDIWKPWPIRWADRHIHGGFGIMLDDVLAGMAAWLALAAARAVSG